MNKKITEYLERIDLTEQESILYLLLIETGPISVKDLATKAAIKRPTTYIYLDQLVEKGLVMKIVKGTNKLIAAVDPEISLQKLVTDKMQMARALEEDFPTIMERIKEVLPQQTEVGEAEIKFYKGKNGVKRIYEEALQADLIRSFVNLTQIKNTFPQNFKLFDIAFKNNPNKIIMEICEDSAQAKERTKQSKDNHQYKVLPKDMKLAAQDILIYDNTVAIIGLSEDANGVMLKNVDLFNNLRILFDFIWKILPD